MKDLSLQIRDESAVELPAELAMADIPLEEIGAIFCLVAAQKGAHRKDSPELQTALHALKDRGVIKISLQEGDGGKKVVKVKVDLDVLEIE